MNPGKIRITHSLFYEDIWIDEYLSLPGTGLMFMTEDEGTPVMNTLFTSGVLIQETEDIMSAEEFHAMVMQQKAELKKWSQAQVDKEEFLKKMKEISH